MIRQKYTKTITGSYTVTVADCGYRLICSSSMTITMPSATGLYNFDIEIDNIGSGTVSCEGQSIEQYSHAHVGNNGGSSWAVVVSANDHGQLGGLSDDDHTQYHNDARGDLRYIAFPTVNTYSADGTITATDTLALLNGYDNAITLTLPDGWYTGQMMTLKCINAAHDITVQPTNFYDGVYMLFDTYRQSVVLQFDGTEWHYLDFASSALVLGISAGSPSIDFEANDIAYVVSSTFEMPASAMTFATPSYTHATADSTVTISEV